jgi:hypothetical protein
MEVSAFNSSELYSNLGRCNGYENVVCPCGDEHVYPIAVRVARGKAITEVTKAGTRDGNIKMKDDTSGLGRGVMIEVEFNCEHGHKFVQVFEFYKGWTFSRLLFGHAPDLPTDDVIWRSQP